MSDMATATGLTKGSIYGSFANKDEVALAVFDYNLQKVETIIRLGMAKKAKAKEKLFVYVDAYDNFLKHPFSEGGCPIINTATDCDDTHPGLKKKAAIAINNWKNEIVALIENGITNNEFNKHIDSEKIALGIIAIIEGAVMITKLTGKTNYRTAIMETGRETMENL